MIPKVSIIVPVHNAGKYLRVCLDSLTGQTLKEIEILLILDKPTDGSDKVAGEYAARDARIKLVYNQENLHTGLSRNEGIKMATGEFIGFTDHDDYCEPEMFEKLYEKAVEQAADVVISNFFDENPVSGSYFAFPKGFEPQEFQRRAFLALISADYSIRNSESFNNMNVIWNQIYRRSFLLENEILFPDNRVLTMEDVFFSIKVYHFAKKVYYLPETYYHHVNTSVNNFENYSYRSIARILPLQGEILNFLKEQNIYMKFRNEYAICVMKRLYASFRNELKFKNVTVLPQFFRLIRNDSRVQEVLLTFKENKSILNRFAPTKKLFYLLIKKRK